MPSSCSTIGPPPRSTLFPYTTLFRSFSRSENGSLPLPCSRVQNIRPRFGSPAKRSEEHTSELQSLRHLVCRLLVQRSGPHRDLHSFPTRRSSDLSADRKTARFHFPVLACKISAVGSAVPPKDRKSTRLNSSHLGISYAVFLFNDRAPTEIYTLSLHDALPIFQQIGKRLASTSLFSRAKYPP